MKIKSNIAISDSGFIFNPVTGDSFSLNETGSRYFQLIKEGKQAEEIQKEVLAEYDIDESVFQKSFYDFTSMLRRFQLLEEESV